MDAVSIFDVSRFSGVCACDKIRRNCEGDSVKTPAVGRLGKVDDFAASDTVVTGSATVEARRCNGTLLRLFMAPVGFVSFGESGALMAGAGKAKS